ncbi:MAG: AraC family transcriptional regulator [Gammaproteobacteria bacterium]|nr:AraC family transcriptional regulator [Gammaproteobacteria bacterium]
MPSSLSIRAYTPVLCSHEHAYHQIVLPLHGVIEVNVDGNEGAVGVGQSVIIQKGTVHSFHAQERSRFLVADLDHLPKNARLRSSPFAEISGPMQSFCRFVEVQLQHRINEELEECMLALFNQLLIEQEFVPKIDDRIARVLAYIEDDLSADYSLSELASRAHLSASHFKAEFKRQTGKSCGQYLLMMRMEKARALLANTDLPVQMIAEQVGYSSQSAFSRRFSSYFGEPPSRFTSR